ncbi:unnamed protein product [Adineta steineri]|uniref:ADP ribosyltransferase domain-containing protein n=1 Tax=Adineta steineri TaxID=433720 RepID=A0A819T3Z0_9BILA|nr:unnamed protein product [Adineta steineri]
MGNNCTSTTSVQTNTQASAKHVSNFFKDALVNRRMNMQRMQNVLLIWLDNNINDNNADCNNTIKQLKCVVNNINTFTDSTQCIEFIQTITNNRYELDNVTKLERDYHDQTPIWWYTCQYFLYSMLNQALRLMDVDIILRIGFFINDLHRDIQRLHSKQFDDHQSGKIFTVYRGQCLSKEDFTELTKTKGGLLSFNNFLSTSRNRDVSLFFAPQAATNPDLVGILFVISIHPTDSTTPFASVTNVSYFHTEDEVLFSMHTVFRIGDIQLIYGNNHLYQVNLTLTNDSDQDLRYLSDQIRHETFPDEEGWYRLRLLLIKMGQFTKAQEIYKVLLHRAANESDKANIYYQLGRTTYTQGEYQEALCYYEKALEIR